MIRVRLFRALYDPPSPPQPVFLEWGYWWQRQCLSFALSLVSVIPIFPHEKVSQTSGEPSKIHFIPGLFLWYFFSTIWYFFLFQKIVLFFDGLEIGEKSFFFSTVWRLEKNRTFFRRFGDWRKIKRFYGFRFDIFDWKFCRFEYLNFVFSMKFMIFFSGRLRRRVLLWSWWN